MIIRLSRMDTHSVRSRIHSCWDEMTLHERAKWYEVCIDAAEYSKRSVVNEKYLDPHHPHIYISHHAAFIGINTRAADFEFTIARKLPPDWVGAAQDPFLKPAPKYIKGKGILINIEARVTPGQVTKWFSTKRPPEFRGRIFFGGKIR